LPGGRNALEGYVDCSFSGRVSGWTFDRANPQRRLEVEIRLGGYPIGRAVAKYYRKDLEDAGFGDGHYAFDFMPSTSLIIDGQDISVTVVGENFVLPSSNSGIGSTPFLPVVAPPLPAEIGSAYQPINGYYVSQSLLSVAVIVNGRDLRVEQGDRSDLLRTYPKSVCRGFYSVYEVSENDSSLDVEVRIGDYVISSQTVKVTDLARQTAHSSKVARQYNRAFVLRHLICPVCSYTLTGSSQPTACPHCGTQFNCSSRAVSVAPLSVEIPKAIHTSLFAYQAEELDLINEVRKNDGVVLDFGAGLRPSSDRSIITVEIADMPSTDLVSFSNRIPFADNTFDGAVTVHVLEHVKRPWEVAQELLRVVKPGATIISTVPFVCPVHGFPYNFFHMTPQGLGSLFENAEVISHSVKPDGHPVTACN
jgi:Methyltransferase domain